MKELLRISGQDISRKGLAVASGNHWGMLPLALALWCVCLVGWSQQAEAQNFATSGTSKELVYGPEDCRTGKIIDLTWTFTEETGTIANSLEIEVYLGSVSGYLIHTAKNIPTANMNSRTALNRDSGKQGLQVTGGALTVADLIGYDKVTNGTSAPISLDDACEALEPSTDEGERSVQICFQAKYDLAATTDKIFNTNGCVTLKYDLTPPAAPTLTVTPSESSITASWSTDGLTGRSFFLYYSKDSFTEDSLPSPYTNNAISSSTQKISGLAAKTTYYFAVKVQDAAGNVGPLSEVKSATTVELTDFYEAYRNAGGTDTGFNGGFCFIATAAYGTYDHKYVQILRDFRDKVLLPTTWGKAFVAWYYTNSPAWANWIRKHPLARRATQVMLLPLIIGSAFLVRLSLLTQVLLVLGLCLFLLGWRLRKRWLQLLPIAMLLVMMPNSSWAESPRNFGMEIRAGMYQPQIDQAFSGTTGPYQQVFGTPMQFIGELHFEWLVFKGFGSIGLGGGAGFTWAQAAALNSDGSSSSSGSDGTTTNQTGLWMIPLRFDVNYRFDYFAQRNNFPLVPYIRGGLDYIIWFVTDANGDIAKDAQSGNQALGGRFGFHFGVGFQFLLDILEPRAAKTFDNELGVNHTYLFVEWNWTWAGILSPGLNLSDSSFRAGLMFQF